MIEVDGLMAAVIPMPNASPSAAAPAEFAAAMALVEGETGQSGAEPGVEQQLATEIVDAAMPVDADVLLDAELPVDTDSLLDAHSPDGRELDVSSLVAIAPEPDPETTASAPSLSPASTAVVVEAPSGDVADIAPVPVDEIEAPSVSSVDDATIGSPKADPTVAAAPPAPIDASPRVAESDTRPAIDTAAVPDPAVAAPAADPKATAVAVSAEPSLRAVRPAIAADPEIDEIGEVGETSADHPEADAAVVLNSAVGASAGSANSAPSPIGDPVDAAAPELTGDGIEALTTPSGADLPDAVVDVATATRAADAAPAVDAPAPGLQPTAVSAPAPRVDVTVAEVADVPIPSAPTPEATPTQQVAEALREVRRLADGSHRLSLQLHPEELGAVQLEVAIRDGQLHVRAVAETEAARSALEQNLPELRSDLRDAGVRAGSLEVGPDASGRDRSDSPTRNTRTEVRGEPGAEDQPTTTPEPSTSSGLDIRL